MLKGVSSAVKSVRQRLKPDCKQVCYRTAEAVPLSEACIWALMACANRALQRRGLCAWLVSCACCGFFVVPLAAGFEDAEAGEGGAVHDGLRFVVVDMGAMVAGAVGGGGICVTRRTNY